MNVNFLLFEDFETLDAFGPAEVLGCVESYELKFWSLSGGTIRSKQGVNAATEKITEPLPEGILLIPGGLGTRKLLADDQQMAAIRQIAKKSTYCLTVCTGSALLAKTGLLDGRKATSNKTVFDWVKSLNTNVQWVRQARWCVDGKYYTSSGVSAGIDMALSFVAERFGEAKAVEIAKYMEYVWNRDPENDPFA